MNEESLSEIRKHYNLLDPNTANDTIMNPEIMEINHKYLTSPIV